MLSSYIEVFSHLVRGDKATVPDNEKNIAFQLGRIVRWGSDVDRGLCRGIRPGFRARLLAMKSHTLDINVLAARLWGLIGRTILNRIREAERGGGG